MYDIDSSENDLSFHVKQRMLMEDEPDRKLQDSRACCTEGSNRKYFLLLLIRENMENAC